MSSTRVVLPRLAQFGETEKELLQKFTKSSNVTGRIVTRGLSRGVRRCGGSFMKLGDTHDGLLEQNQEDDFELALSVTQDRSVRLPVIEDTRQPPSRPESRGSKTPTIPGVGFWTKRGGKLRPASVFPANDRLFLEDESPASSKHDLSLTIEGQADTRLLTKRSAITNRDISPCDVKPALELSNDDKMFLTIEQGLRQLLLCQSFGVTIERKKSHGGVIATPVFHCPRCLKHWSLFGSLPPERCKHSKQPVRGPNVQLSKKSNYIFQRFTQLDHTKRAAVIHVMTNQARDMSEGSLHDDDSTDSLLLIDSDPSEEDLSPAPLQPLSSSLIARRASIEVKSEQLVPLSGSSMALKPKRSRLGWRESGVQDRSRSVQEKGVTGSVARLRSRSTKPPKVHTSDDHPDGRANGSRLNIDLADGAKPSRSLIGADGPKRFRDAVLVGDTKHRPVKLQIAHDGQLGFHGSPLHAQDTSQHHKNASLSGSKVSNDQSRNRDDIHTSEHTDRLEDENSCTAHDSPDNDQHMEKLQSTLLECSEHENSNLRKIPAVAGELTWNNQLSLDMNETVPQDSEAGGKQTEHGRKTTVDKTSHRGKRVEGGERGPTDTNTALEGKLVNIVGINSRKDQSSEADDTVDIPGEEDETHVTRSNVDIDAESNEVLNGNVNIGHKRRKPGSGSEQKFTDESLSPDDGRKSSGIAESGSVAEDDLTKMPHEMAEEGGDSPTKKVAYPIDTRGSVTDVDSDRTTADSNHILLTATNSEERKEEGRKVISSGHNDGQSKALDGRDDKGETESRKDPASNHLPAESELKESIIDGSQQDSITVYGGFGSTERILIDSDSQYEAFASVKKGQKDRKHQKRRASVDQRGKLKNPAVRNVTGRPQTRAGTLRKHMMATPKALLTQNKTFEVGAKTAETDKSREKSTKEGDKEDESQKSKQHVKDAAQDKADYEPEKALSKEVEGRFGAELDRGKTDDGVTTGKGRKRMRKPVKKEKKQMSRERKRVGGQVQDEDQDDGDQEVGIGLPGAEEKKGVESGEEAEESTKNDQTVGMNAMAPDSSETTSYEVELPGMFEKEEVEPIPSPRTGEESSPLLRIPSPERDAEEPSPLSQFSQFALDFGQPEQNQASFRMTYSTLPGTFDLKKRSSLNLLSQGRKSPGPSSIKTGRITPSSEVTADSSVPGTAVDRIDVMTVQRLADQRAISSSLGSPINGMSRDTPMSRSSRESVASDESIWESVSQMWLKHIEEMKAVAKMAAYSYLPLTHAYKFSFLEIPPQYPGTNRDIMTRGDGIKSLRKPPRMKIKGKKKRPPTAEIERMLEEKREKVRQQSLHKVHKLWMTEKKAEYYQPITQLRGV